jgi:hypothetical protein
MYLTWFGQVAVAARRFMPCLNLHVQPDFVFPQVRAPSVEALVAVALISTWTFCSSALLCCVLLTLQVRPPSVEALVAVAAHSFSGSDLLRVERLLLDGLEFKLALPTPYGCLHLLTQVCTTLRAVGAL